jgi:hypothetical protein
VLELTNYEPIPYRGGYPDLSAWAEETMILSRERRETDLRTYRDGLRARYPGITNSRLQKLLSRRLRTRDFASADAMLARRRNWLLPDGSPDIQRARAYRRNNRLTWHHVEDGTTVLLVSRALHEAVVPHEGGVADVLSGLGD